METSLTEYPERRRWRRLRSITEHAIVRARVRPGLEVVLLDISARGVRLQTKHRLLPGTYVDLLLSGRSETTVVRGRVLRCTVFRLQPYGVAYRGAIAFAPTVPWLAEISREPCVADDGARVGTTLTSR